MRVLAKLIIVAVAGLTLASTSPNASYALMSGGLDDSDFPDPPEVDPPEPPEIDIPDVEVPEVEVPETEASEIESPEAEEPTEAEESPENEEESQSGGDDHGGQSGGGHGADDSPSDEEVESVQSHLTEPMEVSSDAEGREYVAREVLVSAIRSEIDEAETRGYTIITIVELGAGDRYMARLLTPETHTVQQAIEELRQATPDAIVTINNAYRSSQVNTRPTRRRAAHPETRLGHALVGVIDTGAEVTDATHPLAAARGFGSSGYAPREHGSAVVSIVSDLGARAQVADVFGPSRSGQPYASASAIVAALRWMIDSGVPVINISIEGPRNPILEAVVRDAARNGHIIVAAAGNGGPLAQPAYPGAYDGVIAVTAVDLNGRAYLRANRGDYVDFAALGVRVPIESHGDHVSVTGTSFAAPVVAARVARSLHEPSVEAAEAAVNELRDTAIDRGAPGRDPIYGWGEIRGE